MAGEEPMNLKEMPEPSLHVTGRERRPTSFSRPAVPGLHGDRRGARTDGSVRRPPAVAVMKAMNFVAGILVWLHCCLRLAEIPCLCAPG